MEVQRRAGLLNKYDLFELDRSLIASTNHSLGCVVGNSAIRSIDVRIERDTQTNIFNFSGRICRNKVLRSNVLTLSLTRMDDNYLYIPRGCKPPTNLRYWHERRWTKPRNRQTETGVWRELWFLWKDRHLRFTNRWEHIWMSALLSRSRMKWKWMDSDVWCMRELQEDFSSSFSTTSRTLLWLCAQAS